MKRRYIVNTHVGDFETWATSPEKAINNIRFRLFGRGVNGLRYVESWTAHAA